MDQTKLIEADPNRRILYSSFHLLEPSLAVHNRSVFSILDLIGNIGGVQEIIAFLFIFLFTVSEQSFVLQFISQMYFARTKQIDIITNDKEDEFSVKQKDSRVIQKGIPENIVNEIKNHKSINISTRNHLKLYFLRFMLPCLKKNHQLRRLYLQAS